MLEFFDFFGSYNPEAFDVVKTCIRVDLFEALTCDLVDTEE